MDGTGATLTYGTLTDLAVIYQRKRQASYVHKTQRDLNANVRQTRYSVRGTGVQAERSWRLVTHKVWRAPGGDETVN